MGHLKSCDKFSALVKKKGHWLTLKITREVASMLWTFCTCYPHPQWIYASTAAVPDTSVSTDQLCLSSHVRAWNIFQTLSLLCSCCLPFCSVFGNELEKCSSLSTRPAPGISVAQSGHGILHLLLSFWKNTNHSLFSVFHVVWQMKWSHIPQISLFTASQSKRFWKEVIRFSEKFMYFLFCVVFHIDDEAWLFVLRASHCIG